LLAYTVEQTAPNRYRLEATWQLNEPLKNAPNRFAITQIAGLVARRIVTNLEAGQKLETGERFGLIRFGSRMDVYLPEGVNSLVCVGQRALAGETILADLNSKEKQRMAKAI